MTQPNFLRQFTAYHLTNVLTFSLNFLVFWLLTDAFHLYYLASVVIAFVFTTILNYMLYRTWIFKGTSVKPATGYTISFVIALGTLAAVLLLMKFSVETLGINHLVARIITAIMAGIWSYFLEARYAFNMLRIKTR